MDADRTTGPEHHPVRAADVMSRPALTLALDESMQDAWAAMVAAGVRHLVVCDGARCVGVLDDRTLFAHWPAGLFGVRSTPVRDLLRDNGPVVAGQTVLSAVADLMLTQDVDGVPVLSSDGCVIGIVTGRDIARAVASYGVVRPDPETGGHLAEMGPRTLPPTSPPTGR
jgi:CBS domain-containing protein